MSSHDASRASRLAISELRAWNTSAFTFSRGQSSAWATSSCDMSPSSASTSAARWSSGSPARSPSSACSSCRRSTSVERCSVDGSGGSAPTCSRRARSTVRQRLRAIAYSHGRR